MKYYLLAGDVAQALIKQEIDLAELSNSTWKGISIEYSQKEFQGAFNDNIIKSNIDYIRILK